VQDSGEDCDDGNDDPLDACTPACAAGPGLAAPSAGEVVITELMINPTAAQDPLGEWIELWNPGASDRSLSSCVILDSGTDAFSLAGLTIVGGGRVVLGFSDDQAVNGGVDVDLAYGTMLLDNLSDEVVLRCGKVEVDRVDYSSAFFPIVAGKSMSLDPAFSTAEGNDGSNGWCVATSSYGAGDLGTPGLANPICVAAAPSVDTCRLATPTSQSSVLTEPVLHQLEIFEQGLTTKSQGVDSGPGLRVELGLGAPGTLPSDGGFTWVSAAAAAGWSDPTGFDAYVGALLPAATGSYDIAGRVSLDLGQTWVYCDLGPLGSDDGYDPADAVQLEVGDNPCQGFVCDSPPPARCDAAQVLAIGATVEGAACALVAGEPQCIYPEVVTDCAALGKACSTTTATCDAEPASPSAAGEIVFSEAHLAPLAVTGSEGLWVELHNPGSAPLNLEGCTFSLGGVAAHVIGAPLVVGVGAYAVLGRSKDLQKNGGVPVDYSIGKPVNPPPTGGATIALVCDGLPIDLVVCDNSSWPTATGKSTALSPYGGDALTNDDPDYWCVAATPYGAGDLGTPGEPNPPCPGDVVMVDSCRIITPSPASLPAGTHTKVSLRLLEPPLTSASVVTDTPADLTVEFGYGPAASAPDEAWTWMAAQPDPAWNAATAGAPVGTDAWDASFTVPPAGDWAAVFRVSADGGNTYSLCDATDLGDGFAPEQAYRFESTASACDPDPCLTAPGFVCVGELVVDQQLPVTCEIGPGGAALCAWTTEEVEDCATLGGLCDEGACADLPVPPAVGQVIFTELAIAPTGGGPAEWVEVTNVSDSTFVSLEGCALVADSGTSWSLAGTPLTPTLLLPGGSRVYARSGDPVQNGGLQPDAVYGQALPLSNVAETLRLVCGTTQVDVVAWDASKGWTIPIGTTLSLAGNRSSAADNDLAGAWCAGPPGPVGKPAGTPGAPNPLCPPPDAVVDFCRFESPETLEVLVGESFAISGLMLDFGNTNLSPGVDLAPGTRAQVGFGPSGADAAGGPDFIWFEAAPDPAWTDPGGTGADRWVGEASASAPGLASLAVRFSLDSGATWLACDLDGSDNGYSPSQAGVLSVQPSSCAPNPCQAPPAAACDGDVLSLGLAPGLCSVDEAGAAVCEYDTREVDCGPYGGCVDAACATAPPGPKVAGALLITEIMRRSGLGSPDPGEWVEVLNTTAGPLALDGCRLSDSNGQLFTMLPAIPLILAPGGRVVLGTTTDSASNGGLFVDQAWGPSYSLDNIFDEVTLRCGGVIIDRVQWVSGWPGGEGVAMQLSPAILTSAGNDAASAWCDAVSMYGPNGLLGTPGQPNAACPGSL
jgi:hypothetical protein